MPAPVRGQLVRELGRAAASAQGGSRRAGLDRGREDPVRGARRGPGDDRHLRPRGRAVPPAVRAHHRQRAARPPDDGAVAPTGCRRRHLGVQLPGRRVVVEHRAGAGLWRCRGLEAVGEDPADRAGLPGTRRRGRPAGSGRRSTCRPSCSATQRSARRSSTTRGLPWCRRPAPPGWARPWRRGSPDGWVGCCWSSAATTRRSSRRRPISTWRCEASCSRRSAPPDSGVRRCAG